MIFTLLILAIGGFLCPVLCKSSINYPKHFFNYPKHFWSLDNCVLEGAVKEEWEIYPFTIVDCDALESCEPVLLDVMPTIGKHLG